MTGKKEIAAWVESNREPFIDMSDRIGNSQRFPGASLNHPKYRPISGLKRLQNHMDIAGINTAFMAEWAAANP